MNTHDHRNAIDVQSSRQKAQGLIGVGDQGISESQVMERSSLEDQIDRLRRSVLAMAELSVMLNKLADRIGGPEPSPVPDSPKVQGSAQIAPPHLQSIDAALYELSALIAEASSNAHRLRRLVG